MPNGNLVAGGRAIIALGFSFRHPQAPAPAVGTIQQDPRCRELEVPEKALRFVCSPFTQFSTDWFAIAYFDTLRLSLLYILFTSTKYYLSTPYITMHTKV